MSQDEQVQNYIKKQLAALEALSANIPADFFALADYITQNIIPAGGRVIVAGVGKSGHIAKKLAASFASTGTPAFFLHANEASHGDLGMVTSADMLLILSNSGNTSELADLINYSKNHAIKIASITMSATSNLSQASDFLLLLPKQTELSTIAAPTISTLMTLALGDALVTFLHENNNFTKQSFHKFHPGGSLGKISATKIV